VEIFEFNSVTRRFLFDEYPLKSFDLGVPSISEHRSIRNYSESKKEDEPLLMDDGSEVPF